MRAISRLAAALALLGTTGAFAQELTLSGLGGQPAFRALSEDLGSALSYKPNTPTEPLAGLIPFGFDVGLSLTSTKLANANKYGAALENETTFLLPTLRAHVGLPFGIDIGAAYASVPGSNIKYTGGELRYAIMSGGLVLPAVGIRGSMTKMSGVDGLAFDTKGLDLSVSKGFAFATPYAGLGKVWVSSDATGAGLGLNAEDFSQNKYFVGLGMNLMVMNINLEADKTGDATSYSAKLGFRF